MAALVAVAVYHLITDELDFAENWPLQLVVAAVASASLLVFAMRNARALKAS